MKFITLLLLTACISTAGPLTTQKPLPAKTKNVNDFPDILYTRIVWNDVKATDQAHRKTWQEAKRMCGEKHVLPILDDWLEGDRQTKVRTTKYLAFEFECQ